MSVERMSLFEDNRARRRCYLRGGYFALKRRPHLAFASDRTNDFAEMPPASSAAWNCCVERSECCHC